MAELDLTPPLDDEAEISLFGPGYGESIVVHLGNGTWLINDSCIDKKVSLPASIHYLSEIGVNVATQVVLVVASHWHDDHVRGLSDVYKECKSATFVCSSSLRTREFLEVAKRESDDTTRLGSGVREIGRIISEINARKLNKSRLVPGPDLRFAAQDTLLYSAEILGHPVHVHSLSPSTAATLRSINDISKLLIDDHDHRFRVPALEPNDASVVLWIDLPAAQILLGADLERTVDDQDGWDSILDSPTRPNGRASAYKVAHHGSVTGNHPRLYSELMEVECVSILTPWQRGKHHLPSDADRVRICATSGAAFSTVMNVSEGRQRRDPAVARTLKEMGATIRKIDPQMGHIQLRRRPGEDGWQVRLAAVSGSLCV